MLLSTHLLVLLGLCECWRPCLAIVRFLTPATGGQVPGSKSWASSRFVFYGPNQPDVVAPVVFLSGEHLCDPSLRRESVAGKVVISTRTAPCYLHHIYPELDAAGNLFRPRLGL